MTIANLIDHTALKPHTQKSEIKKLIEEAKAYQFASVCVNPTWVEFAAEEPEGNGNRRLHGHRFSAGRQHDRDKSV